MEDVVVTGLGAITPLGLTWEATWTHLLQGRCGLGWLERNKDQHLPPTLVGEIRDFNPSDHFPSREASKLDRLIHFCLMATRDALSSSALDTTRVVRSRCGVITGVGLVGIETLVGVFKAYEKEGLASLRPHHATAVIPSSAAGVICLVTGFQGFSFNVATACASSLTGIGLAKTLLETGAYDVILVVGGEAPLVPHTLASWLSMGAMSFGKDPMTACRPFDKGRDGLVMSEGAAALVLETASHARERGAPVVAKLRGYGHSNDAFAPYSPSTQGQQLAVMSALMNAGVDPGDIDYVNAHGTATLLGDEVEAQTLATTFGNSQRPRMGATKSMTGHLMGGCGALEAVIAAAVAKHKVAPPNRNLARPIADLGWIGSEAETLPDLRFTLTSNFGFGGNNAIAIFEAP